MEFAGCILHELIHNVDLLIAVEMSADGDDIEFESAFRHRVLCLWQSTELRRDTGRLRQEYEHWTHQLVLVATLQIRMNFGVRPAVCEDAENAPATPSVETTCRCTAGKNERSTPQQNYARGDGTRYLRRGQFDPHERPLHTGGGVAEQTRVKPLQAFIQLEGGATSPRSRVRGEPGPQRVGTTAC